MAYASTPARRPRGTRWLLAGLGGGAGVLYLGVVAGYLANPDYVALVGLVAVLVGGALARGGKRGAVVGFLVLFVPLLLLGILFLLAALGWLGGVVAWGPAETFAESVALAWGAVVGLLFGLLGLVLIVVAFIAGVVGLVIGGVVGWISGKVLPVGGRIREEEDYGSWDETWGMEPP